MDLNKVRQIEFEITSLCNAACPGCPRTQLGPGVGFDLNTITLSDIQRWLPSKLDSVEIFKFSGNLGDPVVNPELYDIVEWLSKTYHRRIHIHTNGGIRNPEWWSKLGQLSKEGKQNGWRIQVKWAIDGLEDTNHIYRVGVRWKAVWNNLQAYLDAGGKADWDFIVFEHNEHQINQARELAKDLGMVNFRVRFAARNEESTWVNSSGESIAPSSKVPHPHKEFVTKTNEKISKSHVTQDDSLLEDLTKEVNCIHRNDMNLFIGANQTLWPCCMLYDESIKQTSWSKKFIATLPDNGWNDLRLYSMQSILDNEFYQTLEKRWNMTSKIFSHRCISSCGIDGKRLTKFDREEI